MDKNPEVIFDMDGVVADSNPVHRQAIKLFCKKHSASEFKAEPPNITADF